MTMLSNAPDRRLPPRLRRRLPPRISSTRRSSGTSLSHACGLAADPEIQSVEGTDPQKLYFALAAWYWAAKAEVVRNNFELGACPRNKLSGLSGHRCCTGGLRR